MSNQSRQPKGIPTGGQYAASAHAEAGVELAATATDEAHADAYMEFMERGAPTLDDEWRGDCVKCERPLVDDPAGARGVLVHADDNGNPDYDADEDHTPVPPDAVPDLGLTGLMDAENAANGAWEPGQGGTDDVDTATAAARDAAALLEGTEDFTYTAEMGYETNRAAIQEALDAADQGNPEPWGMAMAAIAMESTLSQVDTDEAREAVAKLRATRTALGTYIESTGGEPFLDALRHAVKVGDRNIRTFNGKTAVQWRAEAAASTRRSAESFERSDTDGYLSQWASDTMARKYHACADLAEQGGKAEFRALLDMDGNLVRAKEVQTRYGAAFMVMDGNGNATGEWVNLSQAKSAKARNAAYAKKGYQMGTVRVPAAVAMSDGLQPSPYFFRTDGGFNADAPVVSVGETEDWD